MEKVNWEYWSSHQLLNNLEREYSFCLLYLQELRYKSIL